MRGTDPTGFLTMDEVRQAGVFAWHEAGYLYVEGRIRRAITKLPPGAEQSRYRMRLVVTRSSMRGDERLLREGWSHLEGCRCPLCTPSAGEPTD
jgi:hypothetical protein